MIYKIVCEIPEFNIHEKIDCETIEEYIQQKDRIVVMLDEYVRYEWIYVLLENYTISKEALGYFNDISVLIEPFYNEILSTFNSIMDQKIYGEIVDKNGKVVERQKIYSIKNSINTIRLDTQETSLIIDLAVKNLRSFLNHGFWNTALENMDGILLTDISKWPKPKRKNGKLIWNKGKITFQPLIWFGISYKTENSIIHDCWAIKTQKDKEQKRNDTFFNKLAFNDDCQLDWSVLFNDRNYYYETWIAEYGTDYSDLEERLKEIINSCPINLEAEDDYLSIDKKTNDYFSKLTDSI